MDQGMAIETPLWFSTLEQRLQQTISREEVRAWFRETFLQPLGRVLRGEMGPQRPVLGWVSDNHPLDTSF